VEPASPGSATRVLRVLSVRFSAPSGQYVFGTPERTSIATYSLPGLALQGVVDLPGSLLSRDQQAFYSSWVFVEGGYSYVYGHNFDVKTSDTDDVSADSAFLARVPVGSLNVPSAWRYYRLASGTVRWVGDPDRATPVISAAPDRGVGVNYTVFKDTSTSPPTYVLFTVDPRPLWGLVRIVTYWACDPWGPWNGWHDVPFDPVALVPDGQSAGAWIYHPAVHPEWTTSAGILLSYSVNAPATAVAGNVELYRPRFVRVTLGPA
jgi:hypothetical protein